MMRLPIALACLCIAFAVVADDSPTKKVPCWLEWRGPLVNGVAPDANPPARWSETQNVRWKVSIPGMGHSSPIVWNDRIIITTAVPTDKPADPEKVKTAEQQMPEFMRKNAHRPDRVMQFLVLAYKRFDGSLLWKQQVCEEAPQEGTHETASWASGSPATDGERIYAHFGSQGLYCLDMDGNRKWEKRLGTMKTKASFGEGISPALCGDMVIIKWDHEGPSFITALDKKTGDEKWKVNRDEKTSWATPLVVMFKGQPQIIVSATKRIRSYKPADGSVLWECGGMTDNAIPTPVLDGETVICMSGFRGAALAAIKLAAASGDITDKPDAFAWKADKNTPYVPSPLLYDGNLYYIKVNEAAISCVQPATGKPHYEKQNLEGLKQIYSSPVAAAGRVYVTSRNGVTAVLKSGPVFELVATNSLDDCFSASAALVEKDLYLRGQKALYCIAE